jgi:hypothetical protein
VKKLSPTVYLTIFELIDRHIVNGVRSENVGILSKSVKVVLSYLLLLLLSTTHSLLILCCSCYRVVLLNYY